MTTTLSTDPNVSQRTNVYAERKMLQHAMPVVILDKFGVTKPMPKNKSTTIKFRRPRVFTAATTPLVEGVTPTARRFQYEDVSVSLAQYGDLVEVTDVIEDTHEDPVLNDASVQCGENIGRTQEALNWAVLRAGTNVFYSIGSARTDVNTPIALANQRAVTRALKAQKAMKLTAMLSASTNYATKPVEPCYVAVHHTDLENDVRSIAGFKPVVEYGQVKPISQYELGSVDDVRYICSPDLDPFADGGGAFAGSGTAMVTTSGTSADVYPILYIGKESYGLVPLRGQGAIEPSIIRPGVKSKSDPLGQRGYVGWKMWHAILILNQVWMARLEVAATAL